MQPQIVKTLPEIAKGQKEEVMLAALTAQPPLQIAEIVRIPKIARKSAALPSAMRRALPAKTNPVIMFASAYGREGAPGIAFEAARSAAIQSSGKVLYIHMSSRLPRFFADIQYQMPISLDEFLNASGGAILPFVALDESGLVCAWFQGPGNSVKEESLRILMMTLRKCFDLVILGGDDMLSGGASAAFAELVDGTILVTEAERTRAPVAQRLKRAVEEGGGQVIGAILNRRRYHIPGWIYRLLYGGGR